ncbi:uncharacterized protein METZ01_LOCUS135154 [marine metagenome]|uniref:Uncharacterized protein n=1 Tax=marine metagenome TaxID=408172 RepID=A0A381YZB9_9ZZZZ
MTLTPEDIPVASEVTRPVAAGVTNSRYQATVGGIPETNPVIGDVKGQFDSWPRKVRTRKNTPRWLLWRWASVAGGDREGGRTP